MMLLRGASAAFRMASSRDFVAGAVLLKHFRHVNPLRRSRVSIAWNAGKVAFSDFQTQPSTGQA